MAQREMQQLQPALKELQKSHKGAELSQKQMALYKEHGVNPFGGCIPTLFQLPFLIFIFTAIREYEPAFAKGTFLWVGSPLAAKYPHFFGGNLALPDVPLLWGKFHRRSMSVVEFPWVPSVREIAPRTSPPRCGCRRDRG